MKNDQIFTPSIIVNKMLDEIGFNDESVLYKRILEPSFGDGVFLVEIVRRICKICLDKRLDTFKALSYVYGIEIDDNLYNITISKLNSVLNYYGLDSYNWENLRNSNSLYDKFDCKFDYVVGNPPYIRIHDISSEDREKLSEYKFFTGLVDMYILFYELGINYLEDNGKLIYIAPNSYMRNKSQENFRNYLLENNLLETVWDYGGIKVFDNVSVYVAITKLVKNRESNTFKYISMKDILLEDYSNIVNSTEYIDKKWIFYNSSDSLFLEDIGKRKHFLGDYIDVQYSICTNANSVYVVDKGQASKLEKELVRPVVKSPVLDDSKFIIFPYEFIDNRYIPISEDIMKEKYKNTYQYFLDNKEKLINRNMDKSSLVWYQYGRSQGLVNGDKEKVAFKHILSLNSKKVEYMWCDRNTLIYSGLYISLRDNTSFTYERLKEILDSEDFHRYLLLLGKNKAGGYKEVSADIVKSYKID